MKTDKKVTTDTKTYANTDAGREGLVNEMNEIRGSEENCCPVPKDVINLGKQLEDNLKSLIGAEKKYTRKKLVPTKIVSNIKTLATTQGMAIGGGSSLSNSVIIRTGEEVWIDLKLVNIDAMPEIIKKEIHFYEYLSGSFRVIETTTIEYKKLNIFTKTLNNLTKFMNYFDLHRTHTFNQIKTYKNSTDYNSGVLLEYLN